MIVLLAIVLLFTAAVANGYGLAAWLLIWVAAAWLAVLAVRVLAWTLRDPEG